MANYGWKCMIIVSLFNSVATVGVLTANNNEVNFIETQTVHFTWLLNRCFVLRD